MALDIRKIILTFCIVVALGGIAALLASFLMRSHRTTPASGQPTFGSAETVTSSSGGPLGNVSLPVFSSSTGGAGGPPVFKISDAPVAGATLIDTGASSTVARYVMADSGHVLDLALNTPDASPRTISNTTIPGIARVFWTGEEGRSVLLQYLEDGAIKTLYLALPSATSTASSTGAAIVHFLPDNIMGLAVAPNGVQVAYLLRAGASLTGYIANTDGTHAKKLFSTPLSQAILEWPSKNTLTLQSKASSGVPGIAFSVSAKTGALAPILYGQGLTLRANPNFSYTLYRTDIAGAASLYTESLSSKNVSLVALPAPLQAPLPEQCVWNTASTTLAYCAAPAQIAPSNYLDFFYQGQASLPDALVSLNAQTGAVVPLATPGTQDGGEASDMISLSLSQNEHYLSFIAKDDQTLWGVRLH